MSGAKCFQVEGWRFIDGAPQVGANEWPDGSALATGMCPPAAPATTVPPTAAPSPTTRGPGGGAGPKPQSPPSVPGTRPGDASAADSASSVGATTTTVAPDADTASGRPATTTTLDRSKVGAWADVQSPEQRREAVAIETSDGSSSAGKWLGAGAGAVVLGSVAAVGIAQARRRRPA